MSSGCGCGNGLPALTKIQTGCTSINGILVAIGEKGETGETGPSGPAPAQEIGGPSGSDLSQIRFQNPDGSWGDWIETEGPAGEQGIQGIQGETSDPEETVETILEDPESTAYTDLMYSMFPRRTVISVVADMTKGGLNFDASGEGILVMSSPPVGVDAVVEMDLRGWGLCDGTEYTDPNNISTTSPDLRDKYIVGANDNADVGASIGTDSLDIVEANLPTHTHAITSVPVTVPTGSSAHQHKIVSVDASAGGDDADISNAFENKGTGGWNNRHVYTGQPDAVVGGGADTPLNGNVASDFIPDGEHVHTGATATGDTDNGGFAETALTIPKPPSIGLIYIIKFK